MADHDELNDNYLAFAKTLLSECPIVYHYTTEDRVESIRNNGLVVGSKRNTEDGISNGIYFSTNKDSTDFFLQDISSRNKLVRITFTANEFLDSIFLDSECYPDCRDKTDFIDLTFVDDNTDNGIGSTNFCMYGYITVNIPPKYITAIDTVTYNAIRY